MWNCQLRGSGHSCVTIEERARLWSGVNGGTGPRLHEWNECQTGPARDCSGETFDLLFRSLNKKGCFDADIHRSSRPFRLPIGDRIWAEGDQAGSALAHPASASCPHAMPRAKRQDPKFALILNDERPKHGNFAELYDCLELCVSDGESDMQSFETLVSQSSNFYDLQNLQRLVGELALGPPSLMVDNVDKGSLKWLLNRTQSARTSITLVRPLKLNVHAGPCGVVTALNAGSDPSVGPSKHQDAPWMRTQDVELAISKLRLARSVLARRLSEHPQRSETTGWTRHSIARHRPNSTRSFSSEYSRCSQSDSGSSQLAKVDTGQSDNTVSSTASRSATLWEAPEYKHGRGERERTAKALAASPATVSGWSRGRTNSGRYR